MTIEIEAIEISGIRLRVRGAVECSAWRKYAAKHNADPELAVAYLTATRQHYASRDMSRQGEPTGEWYMSCYGGGDVWPGAFPSLFRQPGDTVLAAHVREILDDAERKAK